MYIGATFPLSLQISVAESESFGRIENTLHASAESGFSLRRDHSNTQPSLTMLLRYSAFGNLLSGLRLLGSGSSNQPGWSEAKSGSTSPLAEIHHGFFDIARPVGWQQTAPDIDVKRRIWPFARPTHQLVLDRVEVHVVDVSLEIDLV